MVSPLVLLVHLLPLLLILFLCMKTRPPRAKSPSKKKKGGQSTPSIPRTQISSGTKSITGRKIGSTVVAKSEVQSTMTAPIVVSGYLPGAEIAAKAPPPREENPGKEFVKSTSLNEDKPGVVPPVVPPPQPAKNRPARSRTSRDKRKTLTDKGGSNELIPRTCEDPTIDEFTCDVMKTRGSGRSIRSRADRVEYQEFTAPGKEEDGSLITCLSEHCFEEKKEHIMGNVDEDMDSDWEEYIGEQLDSEVEHSCLQPTDKDASAILCGNRRIWLANKIGSQVDTPQET